MRLQEAADFVGLWAYLAIVGGGLPDREVMQAVRSATVGPATAVGAQPKVAGLVSHQERPSGWAVVEDTPLLDTFAHDEESDFAAAS